MHHKEKSTEERERRRKLILYSSWGTKGAISILLPTAVQCFLHVYAVAPVFSLHSWFANLYFLGGLSGGKGMFLSHAVRHRGKCNSLQHKPSGKKKYDSINPTF